MGLSDRKSIFHYIGILSCWVWLYMTSCTMVYDELILSEPRIWILFPEILLFSGLSLYGVYELWCDLVGYEGEKKND